MTVLKLDFSNLDVFVDLVLKLVSSVVVLASIVAEVVSELVDTEVYHWFVTRITRRRQWARVLASNSVSVPIDNLIFAVGAFGWLLPWEVVWQIFLFNLAVKLGVTLASMPLIYVARDQEWREE